MDEKTPHLHLTFVPLTKDNRLCAKESIGNRANLTKGQDDFHAVSYTHLDVYKRQGQDRSLQIVFRAVANDLCSSPAG